MTEKRILVINPNSNESVTTGMDLSVDHLRQEGKLAIDCLTLERAPFGIESVDDIAVVVPMITDLVRRRAATYDAFVIGCYSDPGLDECRGLDAGPVSGIQESAVALAAGGERRFGVLALGEASIARHVNYVRKLGMQRLHVGERPLHLSVDEAANGPDALARIVSAGRQLVEEDGAQVLILGCAGMASHREAAQEMIGVPVIEPVQAGVRMTVRRLGVA